MKAFWILFRAKGKWGKFSTISEGRTLQAAVQRLGLTLADVED